VAIAEVEALKKTLAGVIVIDHVIPDYHARYPKACMGEMGQARAQCHANRQNPACTRGNHS